MMEKQRFEALAEAFGGDMQAWPADERAEAEAFAAAHPDIAETVLEAEKALDAALADAAIEPPTDLLYQRIVEHGVRARRSQRPVWAAAAAAIMLTVGMGTGWLAGPPTGEPSEDIFSLAFGALESAETLTLEEGV